jgi:ribonuclease PH
MARADGRENDQLRAVRIVPNFVDLPAGSALIEMGKTRVICTASVEKKLPRWLYQEQMGKKEKSGWITAEYSLLPGAGSRRTFREAVAGKQSGRTMEIQRLIGRSFRSVVDLDRLGARTIWIDCDVVQADGGTRTAAVTGGLVALIQALSSLREEGIFKEIPLREHLAAVSVGIKNDEILLDIDYEEDKLVDVDINVVMTESGKLVEIQGTAERDTFSPPQLTEVVRVAGKGIRELIEIQKAALR